MLTPPPFYVREAEIIATCGPVAAVVFDVLRHLTEPDGAGPSHQEVAQRAGITHIMARRSTDKLIQAGWIKAEAKVKNGRQIANQYSFPTEKVQVIAPTTKPQVSGKPQVAPPAQYEQALYIQPRCSPSLFFPPPKGVGKREQRIEKDVSGENRQESSRWNSLFDLYQDTWTLVDSFEEHIQTRSMREKGKPQNISWDRRSHWCRSAKFLTDDQPLEELQASLAWLFTQHHGYLPFPVVNEWTGRIDPRMRRVTRLAQIQDHYQEILTVWGGRKRPPDVFE